MCNGLIEAGATLKYVYDPDPKRLRSFLTVSRRPCAAESEEEVLADPEVKLVAGAAVTSERCALGLRVMDAGKDYFTDKAPFTTLAQLGRRARQSRRNRPQIYGLLQRASARGKRRFRRPAH